ncbi:MAG: hypothetical protein Q8T08_00095 [Ignavibacteria bacterium]|nr:hypothetical protein [Ignavibacteria bacterium]
MKKIIFLLAFGLAIIMSSCKKDIDDTPKAPATMEELTVPATFDWKTMKDVQLTITGYTNGITEVTNTAGVAYQKAYLTTNQPYVMKVTVPSYETKIQIKFMGQTKQFELSSSSITHEFVAP